MAQAERVETARRVVLRCLPVGRVDPAPLGVGLALLRDELADVMQELPAWRVPEVETQWKAAEAALIEAADGIEAGERIAATTMELEVLLNAVGDVVTPLDAWQDAERGWRRLRRQPR